MDVFTSFDREMMEKAFEAAQRALDRGEVPVGCVFVDQDQNVVAEGANETNILCNVVTSSSPCLLIFSSSHLLIFSSSSS